MVENPATGAGLGFYAAGRYSLISPPVHGSVSVHAYSPPLWRMGQYSVAADGRLRRQSVSYADELRPLDQGL